MVKEYEAPVRRYPFPFELVMMAYHRRYPTCHLIPELLETELIYEFESEDGSIGVTERRFKMSIEAPYILKKITGVEHFYCLARNSLNRINRTLLIESRNESFSSRVSAFETCKYSVAPDNPNHTLFEQKACLEIKNFYGFESLAEKVCIKAYTKTFSKTEKIIYHYIDELSDEGIKYVPPFEPKSKLSDVSLKLTIDEISYRNPLSSNSVSTDMGLFFAGESKVLSPTSLDVFNDDYFKKYLSTLSLVESNSILLLHKKLRQRDDDVPNLVCLYKFLRSSEGDIDKAYESLVKHLNWKRQNMIFHILDWDLPQDLRAYFKGCWHHHDIDGAPMYVIRLGYMDIKGLLKSIGPDGIAKSLIKICEEGNILCEKATKMLDKPILSWTLLVELDGFSLKNAWKPILQTLLRLIEVLQINYPESLYRIILIKAPKFFGVVWSLISTFINEETTKKIIILSSECMEKDKLQNYVSPKYIPTFLGGISKCSIDETFYIIPKSLYVYKDLIESDFFGTVCIDDLYKKIIVGKAHTVEVPIDVNHDESVITWDFDVLEGDVYFCLYYSPKTSALSSVVNLVLSNPTIETLQNMKPTFYKEGSSIQGYYYCTRSGNYILTWKSDPISAKHKKSVLIYYYDVLPRNQIESSILSLCSGASSANALDEFSVNGENYSLNEFSCQ